jgi:hypothetical protein
LSITTIRTGGSGPRRWSRATSATFPRADVWATNFGQPAPLFEKFPKRGVFIADSKGKK